MRKCERSTFMIGKFIFKYGVAKIAPKVFAALAAYAGLGGITVICHKFHSEISYQYDKKAKDDTQDRIRNAYNDMNKFKDKMAEQINESIPDKQLI